MTTDPDIHIATMRVLNHDPTPFFLPTPDFKYLISSASLPRGNVLYVVVETEPPSKAYMYQKLENLAQVCSPCLEPTNKQEEYVPCEIVTFDPDSPRLPPEKFLWNQYGEDNNHAVFQKQGDENLYWYYTGLGENVKFSSKSSEDEVTSKTEEVNTTYIPAEKLYNYVDGKGITQTIENLKQLFGDDVVIFGYETMANFGDCRTAKLVELDSDKNSFIFPAPTLDKLIANPILPGEYILYVVQKELRKAYVYQTKKPDGTMIYISPCLEPTNKNGETNPCREVSFDSKSPIIPPDIFLWNQVGLDKDYKIYKEQTDGDKTKLYWQFTGPGKIVTFSNDPAQALSAKLDFTTGQTP